MRWRFLLSKNALSPALNHRLFSQTITSTGQGSQSRDWRGELNETVFQKAASHLFYVSLICLFSLDAQAQSGGFVIPTFRGETGSDFAYWDLFRNEPSKSSNYLYDNPPALLDGLGMDDEGHLTTAFVSRAKLRQTGANSCFVTSSGALYSFAQTLRFEMSYTAPGTTAGEVTNVMFQTQTGGSRLDVNNPRLVYTAITPVGPVEFELPPNYKGLDDPQTGNFSERLVSAFQWDLTGLNVRQFKITFAAPGTSMAFWQAQLDAVVGQPFSQSLGYLLSTRSRPLLRFGLPGSIDKNLPVGIDGRFFLQGESLNLLADPALDWLHTGWWYDSAASTASPLPILFPARDILVTALFAPASYEAWRERNFDHANATLGTLNDYTNDAISAPLVDHDDDGLSNVGEYAFGGDPYADDELRWRPQSLRVEVAGQMYAALRYRTNGAPVSNGDTVFQVQLSTDAGASWADNTSSPGLLLEYSWALQSDGSEWVTVRSTTPLASQPDALFRVAWTAAGVTGTPLTPLPLSIVTAETLAAGRVGVPYSVQLIATGGTAPYQWNVSSGTLPAGLSLNAEGLLSGTALAAQATGSFTVQVTDANNVTVTKVLQLSVEPFVISTDSALPSHRVGVAFSLALSVLGGTAPFQWQVTSGSLPTGVSLSPEGQLSGSPTTPGSSAFSVEVTDANDLTVQKDFILTTLELSIETQTLPPAVVGLSFSALLRGSAGAAWSLAVGSLPAGLSLNPAGELSGIPTEAGLREFTVQLTETGGLSVTQTLSLQVDASLQPPIMQPVSFLPLTIGSSFEARVSATRYPSSFLATGLPKGLSLNARTGEIRGRPTVTGAFQVQLRARNRSGVSAPLIVPLIVRAYPAQWVGSYSAFSRRDLTANQQLGSRLDLVTTPGGSYSLRLTTGKKVIRTSGHLSASAPHLTQTLGGQILSLTLGESSVSGSHGAAEVTGWKLAWHRTARPANSRVGYYSLAMDLADESDDGVASVPQGSGFATATVSDAGVATVTGWMADGQKFTSSQALGDAGEMVFYAALDAGKGSAIGTWAISADASGSFLDNRLTGDLTWLKPRSAARAYGAGFGPIALAVDGAYLAASARGGRVLGLPESGAVGLRFTDGGLADSDTDPDLELVFSDDAKIQLPAENAAQVRVKLSPASGALSGQFTLVENTAQKLRRTVKFQGQIVRRSRSTGLTAGFFLLPQIPANGQPANRTAILSGGVTLLP